MGFLSRSHFDLHANRAALVILAGAAAVALAVGLDLLNRTEDGDEFAGRDEGPVLSAGAAPAMTAVTTARVTAEGQAMFAGQAASGSTIELRKDSTALGSAEADGRGEWIIVADQPLDAGIHLLSVRAGPVADAGRDAVSSPSIVEEDVFVVVVVPKPAANPAADPAPVANVAHQGLPPAPLVVSLPPARQAPPSLLQPRIAGGGSDRLMIELAVLATDGSVRMSGHCRPQERLRLLAASRAIAVIRAGDQGAWSEMVLQTGPRDHPAVLTAESLDRLGERESLTLTAADAGRRSAVPTRAVQAQGDFWRIDGLAETPVVALWIHRLAGSAGAPPSGADDKGKPAR